mmetsp:Transcript_51055/g.143707  ORF Transcript_51055/g.143707 Transcript_51055/m.143707 type:complete len:401 (+) Transcript_51055:424-1626(+)
MSTAREKRYCFPVTRQLLFNEAPQTWNKIVTWPRVIFHDNSKRTPISDDFRLDLEVRRRAAHRAQHTSHRVLPFVGVRLSVREVELARHEAGLLGSLQGSLRAHVDPRDARGPDLQRVQAALDHLPPLVGGRQAQHVHGDVVLEPAAGGRVLGGRPGPGPAALRRVAEVRVLYRVEGRVAHGRGHPLVRGHALQRRPGQVGLQVPVAHALDPHPAPVPLERVEVVAVLPLAGAPPGVADPPRAEGDPRHRGREVADVRADRELPVHAVRHCATPSRRRPFCRAIFGRATMPRMNIPNPVICILRYLSCSFCISMSQKDCRDQHNHEAECPRDAAAEAWPHPLPAPALRLVFQVRLPALSAARKGGVLQVLRVVRCQFGILGLREKRLAAHAPFSRCPAPP